MTHTRTPVATDLPFDLTSLKNYARIDHQDDDASLVEMGKAAAAGLEHAANIALLHQTITATFNEWSESISLPVGPFFDLRLDLVTVATRDAAGHLTLKDSGWWIEGGQWPILHITGTFTGAALVVSYPAGFGANANDIPADLGLAILDQTASIYDGRGSDKIGASTAAARIIARYKRVRA